MSLDHTFIELTWDEAVRRVDGCKYLFTTDIREAEELTLCLIITEAKVQQAVITNADVGQGPLDSLKIGGSPIETDPTCQTFRLWFDRRHMISYTVLDETYGKYPEPPEQFTGKLLREFTWSYLLDCTGKTTYAAIVAGKPLRHFEIACLNHVVDVICTAPPRIELRVMRS